MQKCKNRRWELDQRIRKYFQLSNLFIWCTLHSHIVYSTWCYVSEKELLAEVDSEFIVKLYRTFQVKSLSSYCFCQCYHFYYSQYDIIHHSKNYRQHDDCIRLRITCTCTLYISIIVYYFTNRYSSPWLVLSWWLYQTENHLHLLLELCQGGELWGRVQHVGHMDDQGWDYDDDDEDGWSRVGRILLFTKRWGQYILTISV